MPTAPVGDSVEVNGARVTITAAGTLVTSAPGGTLTIPQSGPATLQATTM